MKYRAEIDGLRSLAIVPVILFHAGFDLFSGGFVGVDVFFVISGYLITTILIEDIEAKRFSIVNFYERRARRILPALFLVMIVCIPFAWMWMTPSQMKDFSQSLIAVSLFSSNILFWRESGYFDATAEEKPLLHTWSLAVEEQYYVLFPIFLIIGWRFGKNRVFWMIVVMAVISLLISEWGWRNKATANFYLAPTRAWELFSGSVAAFIVQKKGVQKSNLLSLLGLVAIVFSIFAYDESIPFPSVYALVPVIGVVLLVLYADKETLAARLLSSKAFVGIGLISYSAYLWHQPLFTFARIRSAEAPSAWMMISLSIGSLVLAVASWKLIEKPFRNKSLFGRLSIAILSSSGLTVFLILGASLLDIKIANARFSDEFIKSQDYLSHWENWKSCNLELPQVSDGGCKIIDPSRDPDIVVLGDSHAGHLAAGFRDLSKKIDKNIAIILRAGCFPGVDDPNGMLRCESNFIHAALDYAVSSETVHTVIFSGYGNNKIHGAKFSDSNETFISNERIFSVSKGLENAAKKIIDAKKLLIIIADNPEMSSKIPAQCVLRDDCARLRVSRSIFHQRSKELMTIIHEVASLSGTVVPLYPHDVLCDDAYCYGYLNDKLLYQSDDHLTPDGGRYVINNIFNSSVISRILDQK